MRKIKAIFVLILLCLSLTGCGLAYFNPLKWPGLFANAVEQMQNTSASNSLKNTIAKNSIFPQSRATAEAGNAAMKARDQADNSLKFNAKLQTIPIVGGILGFGHGFWADHKVANASRKENSYYSAVASDSILQSAIKNAEGKTRVRGFSLDQIPTWLLMVIIIIIFLFVIALLKKLLRGKPQMEQSVQQPQPQPQPQSKPEQAPMQQSQSQPAVSELKVLEFEKRDRIGTEDGQKKLLTKQCTKKGLNIEKVLAKFNNDVFAANEYIMSTPAEQLEELK